MIIKIDLSYPPFIHRDSRIPAPFSLQIAKGSYPGSLALNEFGEDPDKLTEIETAVNVEGLSGHIFISREENYSVGHLFRAPQSP